jgi:hypothetical protein
MGLVQSYGGLIATRILVWVAKAGLLPGVAYCTPFRSLRLTMRYLRCGTDFTKDAIVPSFFSAATLQSTTYCAIPHRSGT